jgi:hypothetical protein
MTMIDKQTAERIAETLIYEFGYEKRDQFTMVEIIMRETDEDRFARAAYRAYYDDINHDPFDACSEPDKDAWRHVAAAVLKVK